jgi:hypothetical protein
MRLLINSELLLPHTIEEGVVDDLDKPNEPHHRCGRQKMDREKECSAGSHRRDKLRREVGGTTPRLHGSAATRFGGTTPRRHQVAAARFRCYPLQLHHASAP